MSTKQEETKYIKWNCDTVELPKESPCSINYQIRQHRKQKKKKRKEKIFEQLWQFSFEFNVKWTKFSETLCDSRFVFDCVIIMFFYTNCSKMIKINYGPCYLLLFSCHSECAEHRYLSVCSVWRVACGVLHTVCVCASWCYSMSIVCACWFRFYFIVSENSSRHPTLNNSLCSPIRLVNLLSLCVEMISDFVHFLFFHLTIKIYCAI